ncbi:hypothetical protein SAY87_001811 [Trapa incisa]|uniref:Uncharacterized protein n=2 Tax=Trapa TaxID=22665 RepID=A0AAN7QGW2_TRANT|nr:hypothetical protein SAY87_001811 [Trapa incisa]KAK4764675.1 hypothetical protein SAY86_025765 [Trapa natans]
MEVKIGKFFDSVSNFFTGADQIPLCDRYGVGCERVVAEAEKASNDELKSECIMRLFWALDHSRQPQDVQRGIAMLEALFSGESSFIILQLDITGAGTIPEAGSNFRRLPMIGDKPRC